jgi:2-oxoisovalerate dehydrogenase E1 component beta subunit
MAPITLIQAIGQALDYALGADPRVVLLGEDIGRRGGVFLATEGLAARYGADRVIDTPLNEAAIIGAAVGMAALGMRPVAEIQFADYIYPGMDQLVSQAATLRYRSGGEFTAPLVVRMPSGGGVRGGLWHSQSPEAHFAQTPGLAVVAVSTPADAKGLLLSAIDSNDPVVYLEPKRLYRAVREEVPPGDHRVPIGRAIVRRAGSDLTIVSYGASMLESMEAAAELAKAGVSAEVIDLRTVVPWDRDLVMESAAKTGRVILVAEAPGQASVVSEIAATIAETILDQLLGPPTRVSGFDVPYPYAQDRLYLPSVTRILFAAKHVLDY